ncbi:chemotaxis protein CheX [Motilimonas sp. 1_MG-2023]|uniref:chemotaxis protein CheX n=1 Tax=Motilimonas sp. 1_MG-2023 TaxID=3062672 RepID=UPI0026E2AB92|nr:chemotaxis protein CheX [Motilimonas sp. 1_MG-2023]MDO6524113.1 chemotaxis protein CheX [Motilimonas sp. 1_MG-2023]
MQQADFDQTVSALWQHFCPVVLVRFDFAKHQKYLSGLDRLVSVTFEPSQQSVLLASSQPAARSLADVMFDLGSEPASQVQLDDALGEMVNIIAGHLKTALALNDEMTLPNKIWSPVNVAELIMQRDSLGCLLFISHAPVYVMLVKDAGALRSAAGDVE